MIDRRHALAGAAALLATACIRRKTVVIDKTGASEALRDIETQAAGRLGTYVLDLSGRQGFGWREHERFAHCSSFKLSLAAMMLAGAERGEIDPAEMLRWSADDLLGHSPVTARHLTDGLSVRDLAHATLVTSDNTAANVLLRRFGGPAQLTRFWRALGDTASRLDRYEPDLNETPPGTALDTTTPAAMAMTVARLLLGDRLSPESRATLKAWMIETKTGRDRIRAGFPPAWVAGDKTGTGLGAQRQTYVDLAFGGPPGAPPLIVVAYFEPASPTEAMSPVALAALADVGRLAAARFVTRQREAVRATTPILL
jgi:beta-lactamase class A